MNERDSALNCASQLSCSAQSIDRILINESINKITINCNNNNNNNRNNNNNHNNNKYRSKILWKALWYGMVWFGLVWIGLLWLSLVWPGFDVIPMNACWCVSLGLSSYRTVRHQCKIRKCLTWIDCVMFRVFIPLIFTPSLLHNYCHFYFMFAPWKWQEVDENGYKRNFIKNFSLMSNRILINYYPFENVLQTLHC